MKIEVLHASPAGLVAFNESADHDMAHFRVCATPYPPMNLINHLLTVECDEWCLTSYNQDTGIGEFMTLDSDAPSKGSIIKLDTSKPMPLPTQVIYVNEPE